MQMATKHFDSPKLKNKISNVFQALENLKLLFEIPRLYISNHFSEIRKEIDIAVNEKLFKTFSKRRSKKCHAPALHGSS